MQLTYYKCKQKYDCIETQRSPGHHFTFTRCVWLVIRLLLHCSEQQKVGILVHLHLSALIKELQFSGYPCKAREGMQRRTSAHLMCFNEMCPTPLPLELPILFVGNGIAPRWAGDRVGTLPMPSEKGLSIQTPLGLYKPFSICRKFNSSIIYALKYVRFFLEFPPRSALINATAKLSLARSL